MYSKKKKKNIKKNAVPVMILSSFQRAGSVIGLHLLVKTDALPKASALPDPAFTTTKKITP